MSSAGSSVAASDVYTVERIVDVRILYGNKKEYFIKWAGYAESENTWEREDNVLDRTLIVDFEQRRGKKLETAKAKAGREFVGRDQRDPKDKKKSVHQSLTDLASSVRKGHDEKLEKKLNLRKEEFERKQAEENLAKARQLQKALQKTVDDDHDDVTNRHKSEASTSTSKNYKTAIIPTTPRASCSTSKPSVYMSSGNSSHPIKTKPTKIARVLKPCADKPHFVKPKVESSPLPPTKIVDVGINALLPTVTTAPVKTGFEKGYKVDSIVGLSLKKNGVMILVQWESVDKGDDTVELVSMDVFRVKEPAMLIEYFEKTITFHSVEELELSSDSDCDTSSSLSDRDTEQEVSYSRDVKPFLDLNESRPNPDSSSNNNIPSTSKDVPKTDCNSTESVKIAVALPAPDGTQPEHDSDSDTSRLRIVEDFPINTDNIGGESTSAEKLRDFVELLNMND